MEQTRRKFLEEALRNNPDDAFTRYALAMELANSPEAWPHFEYLLTHHAEYTATYYQAGMWLVKQSRIEEARKVLAKGVEVTGSQGRQHAQQELQAALDELADEL